MLGDGAEARGTTGRAWTDGPGDGVGRLSVAVEVGHGSVAWDAVGPLRYGAGVVGRGGSWRRVRFGMVSHGFFQVALAWFSCAGLAWACIGLAWFDLDRLS